MSDKLQDLKSCARGRRKDTSNELVAKLPKVNEQELIDRILVKPSFTDLKCPDSTSFDTPFSKKMFSKNPAVGFLVSTFNEIYI